MWMYFRTENPYTREAPPEVYGAANDTPEPLIPVAVTADTLAIVFFASSTSPNVFISTSDFMRCHLSSLSITNILPSEEYAAFR